jgi:hypothetical protein
MDWSVTVYWKGLRAQDPGLYLGVGKPWCRCDCESELKMGIPVKVAKNVANREAAVFSSKAS